MQRRRRYAVLGGGSRCRCKLRSRHRRSWCRQLPILEVAAGYILRPLRLLLLLLLLLKSEIAVHLSLNFGITLATILELVVVVVVRGG